MSMKSLNKNVVKGRS